VRLDIDDVTCACCGGVLHVIGESVSEMMDWVPAQLRGSVPLAPNTRAGPARRWSRRQLQSG
jgi:transposase